MRIVLPIGYARAMKIDAAPMEINITPAQKSLLLRSWIFIRKLSVKRWHQGLPPHALPHPYCVSAFLTRSVLLLRFDIRLFYDLSPFSCFGDDVRAELGRAELVHFRTLITEYLLCFGRSQYDRDIFI